MADNEFIVTVKANTKPAEQDIQDFSKTSAMSMGSLTAGVIGLNQGLELATKAVKAVMAAIDFAKMGEEINAINTRFKILAEQAGSIPDQLAAGIENAVKGTVDMEDALSAASRAMIKLETGSQKLPELFDIAKHTYFAYLFELKTNYNNLYLQS